MPEEATNPSEQPATRLMLIFLAVAALVIASALFVYWMGLRVAAANREVTQNREIIDGLTELLSTLKDAETGARGFVITGEEKYLQPYEAAIEHVGSHLNLLANWAKTGDVDAGLAADVVRLTHEHLDGLNQTIEMRRQRGFDAARALVQTDAGKQIMDELRRQIARMTDQERAELTVSLARSDRATGNRTLTVMGTALVTLAFLIWAFRRIRRAIAAIELQREALRQSEERLRFALDGIHAGGWDLDLVDHTAHRSLMHDRIFGYETLLPQWTYEMFLEHVVHEDRELVDREFRQAVDKRQNWDFECRIVRADKMIRWIWACGRCQNDAEGNPKRLVGIVQDITQRKQSEQALARTADELARSNKDLAQFAYVASHDLQEPLRMVTGYLQLIERRYKDKLDQDAREFIAFAVDGATRMSRLITDLLDYSRINTRGKPLESVEMEAILQRALDNLQVAIRDSAAQITHEPLPMVRGDAPQLVQLLQNLVGNAIKFRSPDRPVHVCIAAETNDDEWVFSVKDDGIGIEPQYAEKIFLIFQRLHSRGEYPGTGIGLAICKRIVERHGGRIWVQSQNGQGSTFFFTIGTEELMR